MKILAIDSTAIVASSAVCEIENGAVGRYCLFTLKNGMTHSENLLPLVDGALTAGGYDLSAIDLIAVSAGPGSFTGVRIGVATVKGLAYSGDKPVCGVSTLDALYRNIAGMAEVICPVMDARRHQFYNAVFVNGVKVTPDRCAAFENIYAELKQSAKRFCSAATARLFSNRFAPTTATSYCRPSPAPTRTRSPSLSAAMMRS